MRGGCSIILGRCFTLAAGSEAGQRRWEDELSLLDAWDWDGG